MKTYIKTSFGTAVVIFNDKSIEKFILPKKGFYKKVTTVSMPKWVKVFIKDIQDYFNGIRVDFKKYSLDFTPYTENEIKVLNALQKIEYGKTITYKRLAELSGFKGAARFVGNVMVKNNFPAIIPCHRVIKSGGSIGNFGYGKKYKLALLKLEGYKVSFNKKTEGTQRDIAKRDKGYKVVAET